MPSGRKGQSEDVIYKVEKWIRKKRWRMIKAECPPNVTPDGLVYTSNKKSVICICQDNMMVVQGFYHHVINTIVFGCRLVQRFCRVLDEWQNRVLIVDLKAVGELSKRNEVIAVSHCYDSAEMPDNYISRAERAKSAMVPIHSQGSGIWLIWQRQSEQLSTPQRLMSELFITVISK